MPLVLRLFAVLLMTLPLRAEVAAPIAAGTFQQDPYHTRLTFRVSHLGFSNYTAFFTRMDATLQFDPANPEAMQVQAEVDAGSVETLFPDDSIDFNALLAGPEFLDAAQFPTITFKSTSVRVTAPEPGGGDRRSDAARGDAPDHPARHL